MDERCANAFFVCITAYVLVYVMNIVYFSTYFYPRNPCNYHEPAATVEEVTRLPIYDTKAGCTFRIAWRPLHTPWYGFSPSRAYFTEPVHRTLRMPCPLATQDPTEGMQLEGCYPNTYHADARHPPEFIHYDDVDDLYHLVRNIRFFRASAYIMVSPVLLTATYTVSVLVWMAQKNARDWISERAHRRYHQLSPMQQEVSDGLLNAY
jgi:hypothetical protein